MGRMVECLRSGDWLTRERIVVVAFVSLVASLAALTYILGTADGPNDTYGRPLGTDFASFYAAGTFVLEGRPAAPFEPLLQFAREQEIFGSATPFYSFSYPPFFLLLTAPLALLPYRTALTLWQTTTLAIYLAALVAITRPLLRRRATDAAWRTGGMMSGQGHVMVLAGLAFPAVFINMEHGQNGFLTAGLLGLGLVLLQHRPSLAGIALGLLACKPQLGLLVPIALAAGGHWRTFAAATAMVVALAVAALVAFGPDVWPAFLASTGFARAAILEHGQVGWHKMQSVFAWARLWGAGIPIAYAVQFVTALAAACAIIWLWRRDVAYARKAAALIVGSLLATPFILDYDLMLLALAIAFLLADAAGRGFLPWEKSLLAGFWIVPLLARTTAQAALVPLAAPLMLAGFAILLSGSRHAGECPAEAGASAC